LHCYWLHEIKFDGYRLRVARNSNRVRLITKGGYDWSKRYPWIVEAALKNWQKHFVIDGEAVILGVDGRSDFAALHSALNPKSITFFVAFLPLFLSPNADFLAQMIIFETTFLMLAFANAFGNALVASRARAFVRSGQSRPFDDVHLISALPPFERWRPAQFTLFLKLNARFSLPMSSIALNSRDRKDNRLSRHRHHCRVRIRLLAIGTDEAQMTISMPAANSQRSSTSQRAPVASASWQRCRTSA
jgi:hypothetical protein